MPLDADKIAQLDAIYGGVSSSLSPDKIAQLDAVYGQNTAPIKQEISPVADAAKSFAGGVERGAAAIPMIIPNLINQAVAGPQMLGRGIADTVSPLLGATPQPRGKLWQPFYSSDEVLQKLPESLQPHTAQTVGGVGADIVGQLVGGIGSGKTIQKTASVIDNKINAEPTPSADDVRNLASQSFATAESQGGVLPSTATDDWINKASQALPQTTAGKIVSGETSTTQLVDRLQNLRGKTLSLGEAQEIDTALGEAISNHVNPLTGKLLAEGNKLQQIQNSLRDTIENTKPAGGFDAWDQGRKLWATSARMNDVERILSRADMTDNPITAIKTGFRTLANNPSRLRGFSIEEADAIKHAARTGVLTGALKFMGSRLISSMTGAIAGAAGGGTLGAGLGMVGGAAAGTPFRAAANSLQATRGNAVLQKLAQRPAVQQAMGIVPSTKIMPSIKTPVAAAFDESQLREIMKLPPNEARKLLQKVK